MIDRHKGKRGLRKAKEAIRLVRVGCDSPQETLLRLAVLRAGQPEPELNVPIVAADGTRHHEPDLSYRKDRIGIEVRISKRRMHNDAKAAVLKVRSALAQAGGRKGT
jgi:hypothetical protein